VGHGSTEVDVDDTAADGTTADVRGREELLRRDGVDSGTLGDENGRREEFDRRVETEATRKCEHFKSEFLRKFNNEMKSLLCPILQTFPTEPVVAADGLVYDKQSLDKWLAADPDAVSPVSRISLSGPTYPVHGLKAVLRSLAQMDLLDTGDASNVNTRLKNEEMYRKHLRTSNQDGHAQAKQAALYWLSLWHRDGRCVSSDIDTRKAFEFAIAAADLGYPKAMCDAGRYLCQGEGVDKDVSRGVALLYEAAIAGVEHAHYVLAYAITNSWWGFDAIGNAEERNRLILRMPLCSIKNSCASARAQAEEWLLA
tara:strand:- start:5509 stop:6444 length:936 start_codon:yes stop_codon:yes gene_type:complete